MDSELTPGISLDSLFNLSDDILFAFQLQEKKVLFINSAFEKVWEIPQESMTSDYLQLFLTIHPDDRYLVNRAIIAIKSNKEVLSVEFRITVSKQRQKWIRVKAYLNSSDGHTIIFGTATDITKEKSYQETLYKYFDKKNAILDIMAHDLTAPLSTIQVAAKVLIDQTNDSHDAMFVELLEKITEISHTYINKIYSLFNKEFLEIRSEPLLKERVDILKIIRELIQEYQSSNNLLTRKFHFISSSADLFITLDVIKVSQVIINLISNAIKFTHDNGNIWVSVENEENTILLTVKDDGIGIPEEMKPFLFDRYTKAKRPGLKGEPTVGLDLYVMRDIVRQHNGQIWLNSSDKKGSTFSIILPKYDA